MRKLVSTCALGLAMLAARPVAAQLPCAVQVDTAAILSGRNLPKFRALLAAEKLTFFQNKKQIPPLASQALRCLTADQFNLANPGQDYDCCCEASGRLPRRQLVFGAASPRVVVLVYHKGLGIVTSTYITIIGLTQRT